ncbi:unnamed protein product [Adineta ricciae]|uniref:Transposase n=1 Tax=Adineta ricciae TaxID=249248 RepID=A0A815W6I9_ADIRI|nr:unnamed protein product [Adineta ricciae]CAF1558086.1 unnamed protein product [Adineta ricciae]
MDKEYFRFYIKVRTALHIDPIVIHNELNTVFGDETPPLRTVQQWSKWFRDGREDVEDEERVGRPITETTAENIPQVHDLINDDPQITIKELEAESSLSHGTIQQIISDHLQLEKVTARYVSKHLTSFQKAERVRICQENLSKFEQDQIARKSSNVAWVARGDPPPTVSTDSFLIHSARRGHIINHDYYIDNCLRSVIDEVKKQRSSLGVQSIKLHHDNGKPHIHEDVIRYLQSEGVTVMSHPLNSPDLSPCDF